LKYIIKKIKPQNISKNYIDTINHVSTKKFIYFSKRGKNKKTKIDLQDYIKKLGEIKKTMSLNNNNALGKENLKNKEKKILEIFDKAENKKESKSSIADKVAKALGVPCNRKLVRRVLNEKRSSKLSKLL
jgi:hypothetical protein